MESWRCYPRWPGKYSLSEEAAFEQRWEWNKGTSPADICWKICWLLQQVLQRPWGRNVLDLLLEELEATGMESLREKVGRVQVQVRWASEAIKRNLGFILIVAGKHVRKICCLFLRWETLEHPSMLRWEELAWVNAWSAVGSFPASCSGSTQQRLYAEFGCNYGHPCSASAPGLLLLSSTLSCWCRVFPAECSTMQKWCVQACTFVICDVPTSVFIWVFWENMDSRNNDPHTFWLCDLPNMNIWMFAQGHICAYWNWWQKPCLHGSSLFKILQVHIWMDVHLVRCIH